MAIQDISNLAIEDSFQGLVQVDTASGELGTALGATISSVAVTASFATTASYAINSAPQVSASFATSASVADFASQAAIAISAGFATSATTAVSASFSEGARQATSASFATNARTADSATSASFAEGARTADSATSASYALVAGTVEGGITSAATASLLEGNATQVQSIDMEIGGVAAEQRLSWNDSDGTLDIGLKGGNVTLQVGQELVTRAVNKSGGDMLEQDYPVVQILGAQGNRLSINLASADGIDAQATLGVVTETILNNAEGFVTTNGLVRGIDTRGPGVEVWEDGDPLYLSDTIPGGLTNVKPTAPSQLVKVGFVVNATVQGSIYVKIEVGTSLTELYDVTITSASNGDVLTYNTVSELWENTLSASLNVNSASVAVNADSASNSLRAVTASFADSLANGINVVLNSGSFENLTAASASFGYIQSITGSAKIIGDAFIVLNNDTPTERYAGVNVIDSGSNMSTASFQFDGQTNDWFYEYNDGAVDYGVAMFGPEYNTKGTPIYNTANTLVKADGGHHLLDSIITDDGSLVSVAGNLTANIITASLFIGNLVGNANTATTASHALTAVSADTAVSASHAEYASIAGIATLLSATATASYADLAGNARNADSATSASEATHAATATSASYVDLTAISQGVAGVVNALSIASSTASMDLSTGNFFTLAMPAGGAVHINATNIKAGQNVNMRVTQNATPATLDFNGEFKFQSGSIFTASTGSGDVDLVSFVTFDNSTIIGTGINHLV